jgi:hypothetical protein
MPVSIIPNTTLKSSESINVGVTINSSPSSLSEFLTFSTIYIGIKVSIYLSSKVSGLMFFAL